MNQPAAIQEQARLRDRDIRFANGALGRNVEIPSANPLNYFQAISAPAAMQPVTIDGKLFVPPGAKGKVPLVIVVPGSLGVAASHLKHTETLVEQGFASFILDPFGPRGVTSTVANQTQFSFAASAFDVVAAVATLAQLPEIDAARIGLQGHSRGGSAVLTAASRRFNKGAIKVNSVLAVYPWSGHQFLDPDIGDAEVRSIIGDRDDWVSPQQVQGHMQAIRLRGGKASWRIIAGVAHSFDRGPPMVRVENASVSPGAPTSYLADDGAFIHPVTGAPNAKLMDRDLAVYALKAGYGVKGATIGGTAESAALFTEEMLAFFKRTLAN